MPQARANCRIEATEGRWARLQELVRDCRAPGSFVPFLAFESSHKTGYGGDNNAYFLDDDVPYFWIDHEDMKSINPAIHLRELWDFLDTAGKPYFTVPHHTGRAAKYRSFADPVYDPQREPLFEIYSGWGSSESRWNHFPLHAGNTDAPAYFVDALRAGCRYGVIASSDDHCTLPGGEPTPRHPAGPRRASSYVHRGLAGVLARSLTPRALWNSLRSRRCYATTFDRTLLEVKIGDLEMGQEARIGPDDSLRKRRDIRVRALSISPLPSDIVLLRNGEEIAQQPGDAVGHEVVFEDTASLGSVALRDAPFHPEPFVVYYVRIENTSNQTQWASPIWLDL